VLHLLQGITSQLTNALWASLQSSPSQEDLQEDLLAVDTD